MSWFKRSKNSYATDDYLQTTETVSRPMAILYTIIMVFVVGALAFSIFFGGRWLYQHLDGSNQTKTTVVENPITTTPVNGETSSAEATKPNTTNSSTSGSSTTATTTPSNQTSSAASNQASSTASTVQTAESITATGPTDTITVFMIAVIVGIVGYQLYLRKRI